MSLPFPSSTMIGSRCSSCVLIWIAVIARTPLAPITNTPSDISIGRRVTFRVSRSSMPPNAYCGYGTNDLDNDADQSPIRLPSPQSGERSHLRPCMAL